MTRLNKRTIIILIMSMVIALNKAAKAEGVAISEGALGTDKVEYKSEGLRDPFQEEKIEIKEEQKEQIEIKPLPSLQVQGIVWGSSLPQAIINDEVVRVGDTIQGVQITNIAKDGITVIFEKQNYSLSTPSLTNLQSPKPESIKQSPKPESIRR